LGADRDSLGVVADQHGCPTSAEELARAIYAVLKAGWKDEYQGVYHFCQPEPTKWYGFAKAVFSETDRQDMGLTISSVNAITTADYPTPAERPENSVMDCRKFESTFDFRIRPWLGSLEAVVKR